MQALTFLLHGQLFALAIAPVREIISMGDITPVPLMPRHARGVMNLRGNVVPVIDLAVRLGQAPAEPSERTSILLVEIVVEDERHIVGLLVDAVREVMTLEPAQCVSPPAFGTAVPARFIEAMVEHAKGLLTLLSLDRVLDLHELEQTHHDVSIA